MSIVPDPSLVWLIGPSGSGKSTWAEEHFRATEIVSSDRLRSLVGSGPKDLDASAAAFDVLERIATARLNAGLLTVIDTLGFDTELRDRLGAVADANDITRVIVLSRSPPTRNVSTSSKKPSALCGHSGHPEASHGVAAL